MVPKLELSHSPFLSRVRLRVWQLPLLRRYAVTSQSPPNPANFSAFCSAATEARQVDQSDARRARTSEERKVLALEMIADHLALIHADLCSIDDFARAGTASSGPAPDGGEVDEQDRWDNEVAASQKKRSCTPTSPAPRSSSTRSASIATPTCSMR